MTTVRPVHRLLASLPRQAPNARRVTSPRVPVDLVRDQAADLVVPEGEHVAEKRVDAAVVLRAAWKQGRITHSTSSVTQERIISWSRALKPSMCFATTRFLTDGATRGG